MARQLSIGSGGQKSLGESITYSKRALILFSAKERNESQKVALEAAGERWIVQVLPKRFNTSYMKRSPFNHHTSQLSLKQKIRKAKFQGQTRERGGRYNFSSLRPLIMSGTMFKRALTGSKIKSRAPKGNVKAVITIPTGHAIKAREANLIRRMPQREVDTIANDFVRNIERIVKSSTVKLTKSGRVAKRSGVARRSLGGVRSQNTIRTLRNRF